MDHRGSGAQLMSAAAAAIFAGLAADQSTLHKQTRAASFDGTNDQLLRGSDLTGNADGKQGIFSCWIDFAGADASERALLYSQGGIFSIRKMATNKIRVSGNTSTPTLILQMETSTSYVAANGWIHVLASWDLASTTGWLYVNDASDLAGGSTFTNNTIDYTRSDYGVCGETGGINRIFANIAQFYLNLSTSLDLSVEANRRKFITNTLKPVNLGPSGERPTGSSPIIFLEGVVSGANSFETNKGTGGGFTVSGALTDASTHPWP